MKKLTERVIKFLSLYLAARGRRIKERGWAFSDDFGPAFDEVSEPSIGSELLRGLKEQGGMWLN